MKLGCIKIGRKGSAKKVMYRTRARHHLWGHSITTWAMILPFSVYLPIPTLTGTFFTLSVDKNVYFWPPHLVHVVLERPLWGVRAKKRPPFMTWWHYFGKWDQKRAWICKYWHDKFPPLLKVAVFQKVQCVFFQISKKKYFKELSWTWNLNFPPIRFRNEGLCTK